MLSSNLSFVFNIKLFAPKTNNFKTKILQDGEDCGEKISRIVAVMENINDDINNIGIEFVMTKEKKMARQACSVTSFPALALFRNGGHCTTYTGSLESEVEILNWITDIDTIEIEGLIEEVNIDMLQNIIESEDEVKLIFEWKLNIQKI